MILITCILSTEIHPRYLVVRKCKVLPGGTIQPERRPNFVRNGSSAKEVAWGCVAWISDLESSVPISCILAKREEEKGRAVTFARPEEHYIEGKEHSNSL
jgi:hypothetical protein